MKKPSSSLKRPAAAPEAMAKKKAKGLGDDFALKGKLAALRDLENWRSGTADFWWSSASSSSEPQGPQAEQ